MKNKLEEILAAMIVMTFFAAGAFGYILNIVRIIQDPSSTSEMFVRVLGFFVPPIGALVGYF